jgi:hypothetical protein
MNLVKMPPGDAGTNKNQDRARVGFPAIAPSVAPNRLSSLERVVAVRRKARPTHQRPHQLRIAS